MSDVIKEIMREAARELEQLSGSIDMSEERVLSASMAKVSKGEFIGSSSRDELTRS